MALSLSTPTAYGVNGSFWKITSFEVKRLEDSVQWRLSLYYDQTAATNNARIMDNRDYQTDLATFTTAVNASTKPSTLGQIVDALETLAQTIDPDAWAGASAAAG